MVRDRIGERIGERKQGLVSDLSRYEVGASVDATHLCISPSNRYKVV